MEVGEECLGCWCLGCLLTGWLCSRDAYITRQPFHMDVLYYKLVSAICWGRENKEGLKELRHSGGDQATLRKTGEILFGVRPGWSN